MVKNKKTREKSLFLDNIIKEVIGNDNIWRVDKLIDKLGGEIKPLEATCYNDQIAYLNSTVIIPNKRPIKVIDFYSANLFLGFFHVLMGSPNSKNRGENYRLGARIAEEIIEEYMKNI